MYYETDRVSRLKDVVDLGQTADLNVDPRRLPDSDFALVAKTSEGTVVRKYPLTSPSLIKAAIHQLSKVSSVDPEIAAAAAETITTVLTEGRVGAAVARQLEKRDLEMLEALQNPHKLPSYSKGTIEAPAEAVGYGGNASGDTKIDLDCVCPDGEPLAEAVVEGLDNASLPIHTMADAEKLSSWAQKHSADLSDSDKRSIATAVMTSYRAMGYADVDTFKKVSQVVLRFGGHEEEPGMREMILAERLSRLENLSCQVKVSESLDAGKEAYEAILTGSIEVEELASKLTQLDKALGVHTSLPAYETLFRSADHRGSAMDSLFGSSPDDKVYAFGAERITARDLKKLPYTNLKLIERWLGCETTEKLRKDPVGTFESLPESAKLAVLRFTERRTRGAEKDEGLNYVIP